MIQSSLFRAQNRRPLTQAFYQKKPVLAFGAIQYRASNSSLEALRSATEEYIESQKQAGRDTKDWGTFYLSTGLVDCIDYKVLVAS